MASGHWWHLVAEMKIKQTSIRLLHLFLYHPLKYTVIMAVCIWKYIKVLHKSNKNEYRFGQVWAQNLPLFCFLTGQKKVNFTFIDYLCCYVAKLPYSAFRDFLGQIWDGFTCVNEHDKYWFYCQNSHVFSLEPGMG